MACLYCVTDYHVCVCGVAAGESRQSHSTGNLQCLRLVGPHGPHCGFPRLLPLARHVSICVCVCACVRVCVCACVRVCVCVTE